MLSFRYQYVTITTSAGKVPACVETVNIEGKAKDKIPEADARLVLSKKIKDLYSLGWSYGEISRTFGVSKTTVFRALKGREPNKKH